ADLGWKPDGRDRDVPLADAKSVLVPGDREGREEVIEIREWLSHAHDNHMSQAGELGTRNSGPDGFLIFRAAFFIPHSAFRVPRFHQVSHLHQLFDDLTRRKVPHNSI